MKVTSHWVKVYTTEDQLIWEGIIDGHTEVHEEQKIFKFHQNNIPTELRKVLSTHPTTRTEWEPAWEEIPISQIEGSKEK